MSMIPIEPKDYSDGVTKQAFKDSTDINKILAKAQRTGTLSHLQKYGAMYGDFANFDFQEAQFAVSRANRIFEQLPSEVRKEFGQDPGKFFKYVNDPANKDDLARLLPELAKPGRQFVAPVRTAQTVAAEGEPEGATAPKEPSTPEASSGLSS